MVPLHDEKALDGPGRVLVRTAFSGVNPVDVSFRIGRMDAFVGDIAAGFVPGMECCGEVVASSAPGLPVGRVVNALVLPGPAPRTGAYAEFVQVDADRVGTVPAGLSPRAAACIPLNAVTASSILRSLDPAVETVVITGAAGALGRFLVYASGAAGYRTIALARPGDEALLRGLGADDPVGDELRTPDVIIDAANLGAALSDRFTSAGTVVRVRADTEYSLPHASLITATVREATDVAAHLDWWNGRIGGHPEVVGVVETFAPEAAGAAQERLSVPGRRGRSALRW
ncbi:putative NAD(P)H quinone oxidoreductase, PIG3 family [Tsukamurella paurometabola]|nr:putative NAD(P)H quinone oxidoreductase, PIG3 family [Tsukamurella paurometabola]